MKPFLDLVGASGAAYRFRLLPDGQAHVPIAGNYVVVRPRGEGVKVVVVAVTEDLSRVLAEQPAEVRRGARVYTRLNVARATREAEHADLAARYAPGPAEGAAPDEG
ncbi:hypothetical protein [Phenylobacterium sp.]|uniref:hypothetical protein n=1 Tax=Phenylobacterium sp. TaxID=1871053 RepID=UPI002BD82CA6|nr:hypothetical protein [Phenylobacterium sp.]HVI34471.1 hypothetical protein [Phenylobacterium sp.]